MVFSKNKTYSNDSLISVHTREHYTYKHDGALFEEYADLLIIDDELFNNQTKKISFYFSPYWETENCFRASVQTALNYCDDDFQKNFMINKPLRKVIMIMKSETKISRVS